MSVHGDAKRLLDEHRGQQVRAARKQALLEREAVEQDQLRRAQIWRGIPAVDLPVGVSAAGAMLAADRAAQPRRTSPLQEALSGESMTYHRLPSTEDES